MLLLLVLAAAVAAAGQGAAAEAAKKCPRGTTKATIAGKPKCLRAGQRCLRKQDRQYHRYRFHCHTGRLARPKPKPKTTVVTPPPVVRPDVDVALVAVPAEPEVESDLTYTVTARNNGPGDLESALLLVQLPAWVTLKSVTALAGDCTELIRGADCDLGALAEGDTAAAIVVITARTGGLAETTATLSWRTESAVGTSVAVARTRFVDADYVRGQADGITVLARSKPDGRDPAGTVTKRSPLGEVEARVVCLVVKGNRAAVGTVVTRTTNPLAPVGAPILFTFTDATPDTAGELAGAGCSALAPPETAVSSGDILIHDAS